MKTVIYFLPTMSHRNNGLDVSGRPEMPLDDSILWLYPLRTTDYSSQPVQDNTLMLSSVIYSGGRHE